MRPVQYFTPEYLERCRNLTPDQILQFLDDFRQMHGAAALPEREAEIRRVTEYLIKLREGKF
jgi:hypothetical protein